MAPARGTSKSPSGRTMRGGEQGGGEEGDAEGGEEHLEQVDDGCRDAGDQAYGSEGAQGAEGQEGEKGLARLAHRDP